MRISTAEIKLLIKACVARGGLYTAQDFQNYIRENSKKEFSVGQIAGAVRQLADTGDLIKVERGLYRGKAAQREDGSKQEEGKAEIRDSKFQKAIKEFLAKTQKELVEVVNAVNILEMRKEDYMLLDEIKRLKTELERLEKDCK